MRPWRAILLFPARPGAAAAALPPAALLAAPAPPLLLFLALAARGCRAADAAVAASALLLLILAAAAGGALASLLARRLAEGAPRRGPQVHVVFAAWAVTLLVVLLLVLGSALAAALAVLVWGVVAGARVVAGDAEPGHALVASCAGATGAILGLLLALSPVHERMVTALPAPGGSGTVLVRPGGAQEPGSLVLAGDPGSGHLFLARKAEEGLVPEGKAPTGPPSAWQALGRVFFFLGGDAPWGRAPDR